MGNLTGTCSNHYFCRFFFFTPETELFLWIQDRAPTARCTRLGPTPCAKTVGQRYVPCTVVIHRTPGIADCTLVELHVPTIGCIQWLPAWLALPRFYYIRIHLSLMPRLSPCIQLRGSVLVDR